MIRNEKVRPDNKNFFCNDAMGFLNKSSHLPQTGKHTEFSVFPEGIRIFFFSLLKALHSRQWAKQGNPLNGWLGI